MQGAKNLYRWLWILICIQLLQSTNGDLPVKSIPDSDDGSPRPVSELQRGSLRAQVEATVRNAILDGRYPAGHKLVERELCELTGASRSILREALVSLESIGLIERESNRGHSVALLSARQVYEIFELRASLETLAAELFAERASDSEMNELAHLLDELETCVGSGDLTQMRVVKERYYELLFSGCRNREIRRALENIIDRVHYLRGRLMSDPERRHKSLDEMRRLTAALLARDRLEARAASLAHLTAARDTVLADMARRDEAGEPRAAQ
jgi:DNA-binding GntR family transcriptional regulator